MFSHVQSACMKPLCDAKKGKEMLKKKYCSNKAIYCQIMFLNFQELSVLNAISVVFSSLVI